MPLFPELVATYKVSYAAGGSGQNTARVAKWAAGDGLAVSYVGAVGSDENARRLEGECSCGGVTPVYMRTGEPTGTCAALVTGVNRSLVAALGAANSYDAAHLKEHLRYVYDDLDSRTA